MRDAINNLSKQYTLKAVLSGHSKRSNIGFQDRLSLNAGQKYCRLLQNALLEHSAILSTCIKLPCVFKTFVLSIVAAQDRFYYTFVVQLATFHTTWLAGSVVLPCIRWASTRENLSLGVCKQQTRRPACASVHSDQRLCYSLC